MEQASIPDYKTFLELVLVKIQGLNIELTALQLDSLIKELLIYHEVKYRVSYLDSEDITIIAESISIGVYMLNQGENSFLDWTIDLNNPYSSIVSSAFILQLLASFHFNKNSKEVYTLYKENYQPEKIITAKMQKEFLLTVAIPLYNI
jgi:hypothetical protein